MVQEFFFIILILLLGMITSFTDIRYSKIRNKTLILFFMLGLLFFPLINPNLIYSTILNSLVSLVLGYVLWRAGLWTAGDGKLFTVFSFIIPITSYNQIIYYYPSFNLLVNTFAPISIFFMFVLLFKTNFKHKIRAFFRSFRIFSFFNIFLSLFVVFIFFRFLYLYLPKLEFFFLFLLLILLFLINKYLKNYSILFLLAGAVAISFFVLPTINILMICLLFSIFYFLMRFFILEPGRKQFTSAVPLNEIKKGDVLALEKGKNKATKFFLGENRFIELRPEGLTQEEVVLIAKYKKEKKKVFVHQTIPFAPFIFIGALLSILTKSNIIIYLLNLL